MDVIHLGVENVGADDILVHETTKKPSEGHGNATSEGCQTTRNTETLEQRSREDHFHKDNLKTAQTEQKRAKCPVELNAGPHLSCTNNTNVTAARAKNLERAVKVHAKFGKFIQDVEDSNAEETEF